MSEAVRRFVEAMSRDDDAPQALVVSAAPDKEEVVAGTALILSGPLEEHRDWHLYLEKKLNQFAEHIQHPHMVNDADQLNDLQIWANAVDKRLAQIDQHIEELQRVQNTIFHALKAFKDHLPA